MTENTGPLIVLDFDGVIRTWGNNRFVFFQGLVENFISPLVNQGILNTTFNIILETINPGDMTLEPKEEGYFDFSESSLLSQEGIWFSDVLSHIERTGNFSVLSLVKLMSDFIEEDLTIQKCEEIKRAIDSTEVSIQDLKIPPLPQPDIDTKRVLALKELGFRVSLLTIQGTEFSLPEDLQGVFEQVMIAPAHVFGGNSKENKINAYREVYPDENPMVYVADQSYEADVAQGIGAEHFVQVTGDLPKYLVDEIPRETQTVDTLADWVELLRSGASTKNPYANQFWLNPFCGGRI